MLNLVTLFILALLSDDASIEYTTCKSLSTAMILNQMQLQHDCTWAFNSLKKNKFIPTSSWTKQIETFESCHCGWTGPLMNDCVQWLALIRLKKVNTIHASEIPFTSSTAVMADFPSVFTATHTYFELSSFSALMICNDPFGKVKKRSPLMVSWVSSLILGEKASYWV